MDREEGNMMIGHPPAIVSVCPIKMANSQKQLTSAIIDLDL